MSAERDQELKVSVICTVPAISDTAQLVIVKQKDANEPPFMRFMVEDKVCLNSCALPRPDPPPPPPQLHDTPSYVDYLCLVHREIQMALQ